MPSTICISSSRCVSVALWFKSSFDPSDQRRLALEGREHLGAVCGHQHVLFQADKAGFGHDAQLQGEHVARLYHAVGGPAVAGPTRAEERAAVVDRPAQPVTEAMLELGVAGFDNDLASSGVDLVAAP